MAIDWTKPIRQKNGRAARLVTTLRADGSKYLKVVAITDNNGYESVAYYTDDGTLFVETPSCMDLENIPDSDPAHTEIDWTGDVQVASIHKEDWERIVVIYRNDNHVYGHLMGEPRRDASRWFDDVWRFRNKPAEPKRVQAILKMWQTEDGELLLRSFLKSDTTTVESVRQRHPAAHGKLLSVIEIDLHEGEGLEDQP